MTTLEHDLNPHDVSAPSLLDVVDLRVFLHAGDRTVRAVNGVSFTIERGKTLGVVGESGSGKTVMARTIMGLISRERADISGAVVFEGEDISRLSARAMRRVWGVGIAMVFQDPMSSLNPVMRIGAQVSEAVRVHQALSKDEATAKAEELMRSVHIPDVGRRMRQYPHELSGGLRQRVVIAISLASNPRLLIADEPTTSLDVTIQAEILDLLTELQRLRHMSMLLISHDFGVVASQADDVVVMYAGRIVEKASTTVMFEEPRMPYTEALLSAMPRLEMPPHSRLRSIEGSPPDSVSDIQGCAFAPRCSKAEERCALERPVLEPDGGLHQYACWYPNEVRPHDPELAESMFSKSDARLLNLLDSTRLVEGGTP